MMAPTPKAFKKKQYREHLDKHFYCPPYRRTAHGRLENNPIFSDNQETMVTISCEAPKIFFFVAYPWKLHWQLDLALAEVATANKCECVLVMCSRIQSYTAHACSAALEFQSYETTCLECSSLMNRSFEHLNQTPLTWDSEQEAILNLLLPRIDDATLEEALKIEVMGAYPYEFAYSSLCTRYRTGCLTDLPDWRSLLTIEASVSMRIWCALDSCIGSKINSASSLFIFNARFTPYRTAYEFFRLRGVTAYVHERAPKDGAYKIIQNKTISDYWNRQDKRSLDRYYQLLRSDKMRISAYVEKRISQKLIGKDTGWISFVNSSTLEREALQDGNKNYSAHPKSNIPDLDFCFFTSSPDEMIREKQAFTTNSLLLFASLSDQLRARGLRTAIRHHPNCAQDHLGREVMGYKEISLVTSGSFDRCFFSEDACRLDNLILNTQLCIAPTSSICIEIGFLAKRCLVDSRSFFATLFPKRFILHGDDAYNETNLVRMLEEEKMTSNEYKMFIAGVLAYFESETFVFPSLAYSGVSVASGVDKQLVFSDNTLQQLFKAIAQRDCTWHLAVEKFIARLESTEY